jgi:hypothetical protein
MQEMKMRTLKQQEGTPDQRWMIASLGRPHTDSNIEKLKDNKAPGEDNITAELIKYGGNAVTEAVR